MTTHEWRERDDENRLVFYRANHHAGAWSFLSRPKGEDTWTRHDDVPLALLESFRDVLWNKIQRRRAPEKHIEVIDKMIEEKRKEVTSEEE